MKQFKCLSYYYLQGQHIRFFQVQPQSQQHNMSKSIKIHQHLYQMYPSMPRYAADPSQSQLIRVYDHIALRFAGHYGRPPLYFIKSPLCPILFGDSHNYISLPTLSFTTSQSIIIAVAPNTTSKIRLNHFQTTMLGELQLPTKIQQLKFNQTVFEQSENFSVVNQDRLKNEQHNLMVKVVKAFAQINSLMEVKGVDLLVYKDFVEEEFMYSKEVMVYGLYTALHMAIMAKTQLDEKTLAKAFQKVADSSITHVTHLPQLINSQYNTLCHTPSNGQPLNTYIPFPQGYSIIIANTLTPLPQKLTKGRRFNLRQSQIQIGLQIIMSQLGIIKQIRSIQQLMESTGCSARQLLETVESSIPHEGLSQEKIEGMLEKSLIQVLKHVPYANNVIDQNLQFHPYKRLKFFLQQSLLIQQLIKAPSQKTFLSCLQKSQQNASSLLSISSQQIQHLASICQQHKSQYKIIGNGWGGCLAIICKDQLIQPLYKQLIERFYLAQHNRILLGDDIDVYVQIVGKPQGQLAVLQPSNEIWFG